MNERKKKIISIVFVVLFGCLLFIAPICYFFTMPTIDEQLHFSPFYREGVWATEDGSIVITSQGYDVTMTIYTDDARYDLEMNYLSTRGFSHKYAVVINIYADDGMVYSCAYNFEEDSFSLFRFYANEKSANPVATLFTKKTKLIFYKQN